MGRKKHECTQMMIEEFKLDLSVDEFMQISYEREAKMFRGCEKMPGAARIVKEVAQIGIPLGLATGSSGCVFSIKSSVHPELFAHFHAIVVGDDPAVVNGKPAPDIFLEAARRLNLTDLESVLVIEDSRNGVKAALAAGMHVAWIPDPCLTVEELETALVQHPRVALFKSLTDLQEALFQN
jgi:pseudouridine-5'-monophosphatase